MENGITWPLAINVIRGNSENNTYGNVRKNANGSIRPHQGWDFAAAIGTAVYAIADGKVKSVANHGDYGLQICIEFHHQQSKRYAFYAHLSTVTVGESDDVKMDQHIGATGNTGNAKNLPHSEDHLHFEIRTKSQPGVGLHDRISPLKVYGKCPLHVAIPG
jgi:murein DD-endopeptidase MepM/ murein hydrolase activator NlpD